MINILLTLKTMRQIINKPCSRSLGPWCRKMIKIQERFKKLENIANFFIADIKILKNIP